MFVYSLTALVANSHTPCQTVSCLLLSQWHKGEKMGRTGRRAYELRILSLLTACHHGQN